MEPITKDFLIEILSTTLATSFGAFRIEMKDEFQKVRDEFNIRYDYLEQELQDFKKETQENFSEMREELKDFKYETGRSFEGVKDMISYIGERVCDNHESRITYLERSIA